MAKPVLEERLWTTSELAERYRMSPLTLRKWRCIGIGPRAIKVGRRALYPESEIARWEANRRRTASSNTATISSAQPGLSGARTPLRRAEDAANLHKDHTS